MMPHVDDGTLHALLDGALGIIEPDRAGAVRAHLQGCAECRSRLEDAAALRGRADGILAQLEPSAVPDFEEVLVRAGARRTGLRSQLRWTRGAAWAATLVVALGTGYLIRDRLVPDRAATDTTAMAERVAPTTRAASAEAREESAREPERGEGAPASTTPPSEVPAVADAALPAMADAAPPARAVPAGEVAEPRLGLIAGAGAPRAAPAGRVAAQAGPVAGGSPGHREVAPEDVEGMVGAPLMVLPGGEVVRTLVRTGESGAAVEVVSLQRLSGGVEIRVTQRPVAIALEGLVVTGATTEQRAPKAAPAPAAAPPPAASRLHVAASAEAVADAGNSAVVGAGLLGWELRLEGPLPGDALAALGAAARPYVRGGGR